MFIFKRRSVKSPIAKSNSSIRMRQNAAPLPIPFDVEHVIALQISMWDHSRGPVRLACWRVAPAAPQSATPRDTEAMEEIIDKIQRIILQGEIVQTTYDYQKQVNSFSYKVKIMPDMKIAAPSMTFCATRPCQEHQRAQMTNTYTISIVLPVYLNNEVGLVNKLLFDRLHRLCKLIHSLIGVVNDDSFLHAVEPLALSLIHHCDVWYSVANVPPSPPRVEETLFHRITSDSHKEFLAQVITAFLCCHGYCVIYGTDFEEVSSWVLTLQQFLNPKERFRVRCVDWTGRQPRVRGGGLINAEIGLYVPELRVQGWAQDEASLYTPKYSELLNNSYPVALINIRKKLIEVTHTYEYFPNYRKEQLLNEVTKCTYDCMGTSAASNRIEREFRLQTFSRASPVIRKFVEFALRQPAPLRAGLLQNFVDTLYLRASRLLRSLLQSQRNSTSAGHESFDRRDRMDTAPSQDDFENEEDQMISLCIAEEMSAGIFAIGKKRFNQKTMENLDTALLL